MPLRVLELHAVGAPWPYLLDCASGALTTVERPGDGLRHTAADVFGRSQMLRPAPNHRPQNPVRGGYARSVAPFQPSASIPATATAIVLHLRAGIRGALRVSGQNSAKSDHPGQIRAGLFWAARRLLCHCVGRRQCQRNEPGISRVAGGDVLLAHGRGAVPEPGRPVVGHQACARFTRRADDGGSGSSVRHWATFLPAWWRGAWKRWPRLAYSGMRR